MLQNENWMPTLLCSVPKSTPTTAMMKIEKERKKSSKRVDCQWWRQSCFYAPKNASARKRPTRPRACSPAFQAVRPSFRPLPLTFGKRAGYSVHRYLTSHPRGAGRTELRTESLSGPRPSARIQAANELSAVCVQHVLVHSTSSTHYYTTSYT